MTLILNLCFMLSKDRVNNKLLLFQLMEFQIGLQLFEKWWRRVHLPTLVILLLCGTCNPFFRIALALHIGLLTILYIIYSPVVIFRSLSHDKSSLTEERGLIATAKNFIPLLISSAVKKSLSVVAKLIQLATNSRRTLNFQRYSEAMTFGMVSFRKLISIGSWGYITTQDDEGMHTKALLLFCFVNFVQYRFLSQASSTKQYQVSFSEGIKSFKGMDLKTGNKSKIDFQKSLLSRLSLVVTLAYMGYFYNVITNGESVNYFVTDTVAKLILVIDSLFASSLWAEMYGLELNFSKTDNAGHLHV